MIAALLIAFALAHGEPVQATRAHAMAREIRRATRDPDLQAATAATCWTESSWGRWGHVPCGCDPRRGRPRDLRWQVRCAAGSLSRYRRECGSWVGALSRYRHGDRDCRVIRYGRVVEERRAWLAARLGAP